MSKPDKYKPPSEQPIAVPATATNSSNWKPYTQPYTGAGAQRSGPDGNWVAQRRVVADCSVPSHAAPPLYIVEPRKVGGGNGREKAKDSVKGKDGVKNEGKDKGSGAGDEQERFDCSFPASGLNLKLLEDLAKGGERK